jgi:hypothetical protein
MSSTSKPPARVLHLQQQRGLPPTELRELRWTANGSMTPQSAPMVAAMRD